MLNLLRWTPDKVDMYQMFKIFVDLKIPFKVDTCIFRLTDIVKRKLRAKNWRSFSVDLQFPSKVDKWQMFGNSMDLQANLLEYPWIIVSKFTHFAEHPIT